MRHVRMLYTVNGSKNRRGDNERVVRTLECKSIERARVIERIRHSIEVLTNHKRSYFYFQFHMDLPSALQLNKETSIAATTKKGHDPRQALAQLHLADRAVNHSFFQRHEIKEGLLTPAVKQLILEAPFRPQQIDEDTIPRKIICRTHTGFRSRTTKELAVEKMERKRVRFTLI